MEEGQGEGETRGKRAGRGVWQTAFSAISAPLRRGEYGIFFLLVFSVLSVPLW